MPEPLNIPVLRDPSYLADDRLALVIEAQAQPDFIHPQDQFRGRRGFGFGHPTRTLFGRIVTPGNLTPFGAGAFGVGGRRYTHASVRRFAAGDYDVELTPSDELGNAGPVTSGVIAHRPAPPSPTGLTVSDGSLNWTWSG